MQLVGHREGVMEQEQSCVLSSEINNGMTEIFKYKFERHSWKKVETTWSDTLKL